MPTDAAADLRLQRFSPFAGNPIIVPRGTPGSPRAVVNPAAAVVDDEVWLVFRGVRDDGHGRTSCIYLATSRDGRRFRVHRQPLLEPALGFERPHGCEDPRIARIGDAWYMTYTGFDGTNARLALAVSHDLLSWRRLGPIIPWRWAKSGAILDTPVAGHYWMYFSDRTTTYVARSPESDGPASWTVVGPVLAPRPHHFDSAVVGPGPQPILTPSGIVVLYNGGNGADYAVGRAVFDPNDPARLVERRATPLIDRASAFADSPRARRVRIIAQGLVLFRATWHLYFGIDDKTIGGAVALPLDEDEEAVTEPTPVLATALEANPSASAVLVPPARLA